MSEEFRVGKFLFRPEGEGYKVYGLRKIKECADDGAETFNRVGDTQTPNVMWSMTNMANMILRFESQIAEYQRLLKAAVDDLNFESQCRNCKYRETGLDNTCKDCRGHNYEWRYADEFKKLYDSIIEATDNIYSMLGIDRSSNVSVSEIAKISYEYQEPKEDSGLISE